jgi:hypothetical protein
MTSQIFKTEIPNKLLIDLLNEIAIKSEKCYVLNNNSFKKGVYNNRINQFIQDCKPYYYLSKHKYLDRKINYNSFITIIRQICKYNKISYTSQIKYDRSNYDIVYYINF